MLEFLAAFGVVVWRLPAALPGAAVLAIAAVVWFAVALLVYSASDRLLNTPKRRR